jgi:predicted  nucleic acid-binding Zn-ribbon protein
MIDKLKTLAHMQRFDDEIGRCRELQRVLPRQLHDLIQAVEDSQAKVQETQNVKDGIVKRQKDQEAEIKHNNDLKLKYGNQLADIKTNKEYKALNSEIANLTQKNSDIESSLLELMDTEAEINRQLAVYHETLKKAEKAKSDKEDDLRHQIDELDGKIEHLRKQRTDLALTLKSDALVKQYGHLIKNKNNTAVAYNLKGACSGCGFVIRPQISIELELRKKIHNCESCGRILMNRFTEEEIEQSEDSEQNAN